MAGLTERNKLLINGNGFSWLLVVYCLVQWALLPAMAQSQACPVNINYATGDLANWSAVTGLVNGSTKSYPSPNVGTSVIPEYNITLPAINVITTSGIDTYGGFPTIPVINGYAYNYAIKLGSIATSYDLRSSNNNPGGFTRSVTYRINVPAGSNTVPYTMTYAYAMVLENGTHNSNQQPLFKATLSAHDSVITCASPQYYLPTFNNAGSGNGNGNGGTGATLDSAAAKANGFTNSPVLFLSHGGAAGNAGTYLQDVWTKGWTEVTFDLSAYRGQQVTLTFESDNCAPGAHFAYAYVALRNNCAGLEISGDTLACINGKLTYSVPSLASATYTWSVPQGWTIDSGANSNTVVVTPGNSSGNIIAREINGCADLRDTLAVAATLPTVAGSLSGGTGVCTGINSTVLTLSGQRGQVLNWMSSTDGVSWTPIASTGSSYTVQNLTTTTQYKALVQNGTSCRKDSSTAAVIQVSPLSKGGKLSPENSSFCAGQTVNTILSLTGQTGLVSNWQSSIDKANWSPFSPRKTDTVAGVGGLTTTTYYRTIVQSGVCPADTSTVATVAYSPVPFPAAAIAPDSATICYGDSLKLNAFVSIGTNYSWTSAATLTGIGDGTIPTHPFTIEASARPIAKTNYILNISNAGCPNLLRDTFTVAVTPRIIVFAGNDTSIVAGQPLQLFAKASNPAANQFSWSPSTGLNFSNISNPLLNLNTQTGESVTYQVRVATSAGCFATDNIKVTVYKTAPSIFVPTAFTPNGDGRNDFMLPITAGIQQLVYFRIYNRWGQLVFSTSEVGKGWDGTINGQPQSTGSFVYMVQAIDYTGKTISQKGTLVLIR
ncbi:MAG: gliding motility-associated C-terminal domain-containing protein [Williamsia sp.]|nr:gliding motility-associated C-terminal domain-containing protein [Williamsia sp.]